MEDTKQTVTEEIVGLVKKLESVLGTKVQNCNIWRQCINDDCDWKVDIQTIDNLTVSGTPEE